MAEGLQGPHRQGSARKDDGAQRFAEAVSAANMGDPPTVKELAEYLGVSADTCRKQLKRYNFSIDKNTGTVRKNRLPAAE